MEEESLIQKTLAIAVISFLCCLAVMPGIIAITHESPMPLPVRLGTTLYVGGGGPGNYTMIQDAVNASVDGDTVFVYVKYPFYNENIQINKSISLIGENHNVFIEAKDNNLPAIRIVHDSVKINGIKITLIGSTWTYSNFGFRVENSSFVNISDCHMWNYICISFCNVKNSSIFHNIFDFVEPYGIMLAASNENSIQNNLFYNHFGSDILIYSNSNKNVIQNNNFSMPYHFMYAVNIMSDAGTGNKIIHNNIYPSVVSDVHSYWHENYYEGGLVRQYFKILDLFPKIIAPSHFGYPMINVDWHPARHPYDIPWP